jgi:flagellar biosynthetic protein FliR
MNPFDTTAGLALLLVRPGMLVVGTPFFGNVYAPTHARIGITLLLALTLAPFVTMPGTLTGGSLVLVVLRELVIGLALALALRTVIFAAEFAGHFCGYQVGLSMGAMIDPQSGVRNDLLAILYSSLAIVICLSTNAHHLLLRALADSYTALPIGLGGVGPSMTTSVTQLLGLVFLMGVRLALPVIVVLGLVELALALIARVAPSLNVLVAGAPVRVIVGLLAVAATIGAMPTLVSRYVPDALTFAAELARAFR